jgi:hypothetical protein
MRNPPQMSLSFQSPSNRGVPSDSAEAAMANSGRFQSPSNRENSFSSRNQTLKPNRWGHFVRNCSPMRRRLRRSAPGDRLTKSIVGKVPDGRGLKRRLIPVKSLGKTLDTLGRVREDIAARMSFDTNYVYCPGSQGVSGEIAHRMRQQRGRICCAYCAI